MLSLLLPPKVILSVAPGYIKLQGPNGNFIKKLGNLNCHLVESSEGLRLFVEGSSSEEESTVLSHISQLCVGLVRGYRRRLRLRGIGFRGIIREQKLDQPFFTKSYRRKRFLTSSNTSQSLKVLSLKIGYSHELSYPLAIAPDVQIQASRLEGRTKGTVISLKSKDSSTLNQVASEIRAFRLPDAYKGKGIHFDREQLQLKKGKRQGLYLFRSVDKLNSFIFIAKMAQGNIYKPRYSLAYLAKSKVWPYKDSYLRRFYALRARRVQRGGLFRRCVLVATSRK